MATASAISRASSKERDYFAWLGVDAVWFSPFFTSPMADFGYDISNYLDIDPSFGTLADFDELVAALHARNIRVILDYVPNHTSDQHPWFLESRKARDNPKRDWYFWRDPAADGGPPNNWQSLAGGSSWEFDARTRQYYCHTFLKQQCDLNWRNAAVRDAMHDVLRFWLDRGVDGFRVDAVGCLAKDPAVARRPAQPGLSPGRSAFRTQSHGQQRQWRQTSWISWAACAGSSTGILANPS